MLELSRYLGVIARQMGASFSLNGRPLTMDEVFSPTGLLPGIARRADQLCSLCLGYGIGARFEETEGAVLGVSVAFDDITPNTLRLMCMVDVLHELTMPTPKGGLTELDQLLYD